MGKMRDFRVGENGISNPNNKKVLRLGKIFAK